MRTYLANVVLLLAWWSLAVTNEAFASATKEAKQFLIKPRSGVASQQIERFRAEKGCRLINQFSAFGGIQVLLAAEGHAVTDLVREYQKSGLVEYAEPDYSVRLAGNFPNDPFFLDGTQWGLNNAGQNGGIANADIDAPEAWSARTSASNIVVAVVDSGIRYTHEDLAGNMWTNSLDGSHGTNAVAASLDPNDDYGHGTRIAGVIGARADNGVGVAGMAWRVKLMACKFTDQFGNGSLSDAIACLDYARANGAQIVNASWGLDSFSQSLSNAIAALRDAGILVVAAAGNAAHNTDLFPHYPACYDLDNVTSVMATTRRDEIYSLSNVGPTNVDLAAPGDEIYSTDYQSDTAYASDFGTSMATAYVTGAAALLRAAHPSDPPAQIRARILATVDPLPTLNGACLSGGRLNLRKVLSVPLATPMLNAALVLPEKNFLLRLSADPGRYYIIETSTNFGQWQPAYTNLTAFDGTFTVTNAVDTNVMAQFYRARLAP